MKIIKDIIWSAVQGSYFEKSAVRALLTAKKSKGSFLNANNLMYTGLVDYVYQKLSGMYDIEIIDKCEIPRIPIQEIDIDEDYLNFPEAPGAKLRPYQISTAKKAIHKRRGIIEAAPGAGKSEIAAIVIKYLIDNKIIRRAFFVAGTRFLMNQAASRFELRGIKGVSRFGAGHKFKSSPIQVCVVDSLHRAIQRDRFEVVNDLGECDLLMFDEAHHLSAKSWVSIGEVCTAIFRLGLTATVWEDPSLISHSDLFLLGLTGVPLCYITSKILRNRGYLADPLITMLSVTQPVIANCRGWKSIYTNGIVKHGPRNSVAISVSKSMYDGGHKVLILVNRIKHGLLLCKYLTEMGCADAYFVKGGDKMYTWRPSGRWDQYETSIEDLAELINESDRCILIATQIADEGVDLPSVSSIVMCSAMKKYRRTVQRLGRGMRPKPGDNRVYVFDFVDGTHEVLMRHSLKRIDTYETEEMKFSPSLEFTSKAAGVDLQVYSDLFKWKNINIKVDKDDF